MDQIVEAMAEILIDETTLAVCFDVSMALHTVMVLYAALVTTSKYCIRSSLCDK